ncbi:MAG: TRAP transporter substrate-binding protein DctP [Rhodospirillaceae bacterium]|jgi:TRAP-type transport system periplasmic protein|nr:TRAP transporter substrate-binding protein DctP [Rhodospirillaceae bacterium]
MMKQIGLLMATVAVGVMATTATAGAAEFNLRWGHYLGKGPFLEIEEDFAAQIAKRTGGRVNINITYSGGLGKGNEVLTLAGRGAIDMASAAPGYYAQQLHFWKAFQIPFVFKTPKQAMNVLAKSLAEFPVYKQEMDKMNVNWLFQQPLGIYFLTGPSSDCETVAGLKGKKLRSFGGDVPKAHAAIGAVPVSISPVKVYEALQRGTIDYSFLNAGNIQQYKLYEPGKYSCGPIMAITGHNVVIGKKTWNRLPKDIQDIFADQSKKTHAKYLAWLESFESSAVANIEKAGGVFKAFPTSELNKWKAAAPDLLTAWEKDINKKRGDTMASKVAKRWRELTK